MDSFKQRGLAELDPMMVYGRVMRHAMGEMSEIVSIIGDGRGSGRPNDVRLAYVIAYLEALVALGRPHPTAAQLVVNMTWLESMEEQVSNWLDSGGREKLSPKRREMLEGSVVDLFEALKAVLRGEV